MTDLLYCRDSFFIRRLGDGGIFQGETKIVRVGIREARFESRLPGEPLEEGFQGCQSGVSGRLAQGFKRPSADLSHKVVLKGDRLFRPEGFEALEPGIHFKAIQRLRDRVDRRLASPPGLFEINEIGSLNALVFGIVRFHG